MLLPKTLCVVAHYFGPSPFEGGSTSPGNRATRQKVAEQTVRQIRSLGAVVDVDLLVYGIRDAALIPVDVDLTGQAEPAHILWKAFAETRERLRDYEYFLFLEDDLFIPRRVLSRLIAAEAELGPDTILLPNRIEFIRCLPFTVDLLFQPEWTGYSRAWRGRIWHEAKNSHSGMLFMSRRQMAQVYETVDFSKPTVGEFGYFMSAAFRNAHRDFRLLRERALIPTHFVIHQDSWLRRHGFPRKNPIRSQIRIAVAGRRSLTTAGGT